MPNLAVGQQVWIRCKVQPGPFSDEPLITIEAADGPFSGFIQIQELSQSPDGQPRVRGIVRGIQDDMIEAWIRGSFFTTNGLTHVPREMAVAA